MTEGIIVGADAKEEWLLSWWWSNYSRHMNYPVCFMDFGMSKEAAEWCKTKGQYLPITEDTEALALATDPPPGLELLCGEGFREKRKAWFKKPFACSASPFSKSIWVDLDCLILDSLASIFDDLGKIGELSLVREPPEVQMNCKKNLLIEDGEVLYNTGVVGFLRDSIILQDWMNILKDTSYHFPGDQDALSKAIFLKKFPVVELSPLYNWPWCLSFNRSAAVIHFWGKGKDILRKTLSEHKKTS